MKKKLKNSKKLLDEKYILEKRLRNKRLSFWWGLILTFFFFWTGLGLILGIYLFFFGIFGKEKIEKQLIYVNHELNKKE